MALSNNPFIMSQHHPDQHDGQQDPTMHISGNILFHSSFCNLTTIARQSQTNSTGSCTWQWYLAAQVHEVHQGLQQLGRPHEVLPRGRTRRPRRSRRCATQKRLKLATTLGSLWRCSGCVKAGSRNLRTRISAAFFLV